MADFVGGARSAKAAHMADCAGWGREIVYDQGAVFGFPIPGVVTGHVSNAMGRFLVNLPLRMVWPYVALVAGFGFAGLFQAEFMAQMAFLTLVDGLIGMRFANIVTHLAGKAGDGRSF